MRPKTSPSRPAEPTVVFHDRHEMEDAVHALVDAGVRPRDIRVAQAIREGRHIEAAPERGGALSTGLVLGAFVGGTSAVLWMLGLRAAGLVEVALPWIVLRLLGGIASGAVLGGLLALVIAGLARGGRRPAGTPTGDFVVTVKTPNEHAGADVRGLLVHCGGAPVPA